MSQRWSTEDNQEASATGSVRLATRRDLHAVVMAQAEWLDAFCKAHPAAERWCPAQVDVPRLEDNRTLLDQLPYRQSDRWSAVLASDGRADAYILCRTNATKKELSIRGHYPRVSPRAELDGAGGKLLEFVIGQADERKLRRVCMSFHGLPGEVDPLISLYEKYGFQLGEGQPRLEMVSRQLAVDPGRQRLQFRSAEEVGPDALYEIEARAEGWSLEGTKENLKSSREMWSVPDSDWLAAYEGPDPVGLVRVAATRDGLGVVDALALLEEYRGRGLGICLLAGGLSRLSGKTDVVWLDVDCDNVPALRIYKRAGFQVHHRHGNLTLKLNSVRRCL